MKRIFLIIIFLISCDPTRSNNYQNDGFIEDGGVVTNPSNGSCCSDHPSPSVPQYNIPNYPRELRKRIPPLRF